MKKIKRAKQSALVTYIWPLALATLGGCGQDPSFLDVTGKKTESSEAPMEPEAGDSIGVEAPDEMNSGSGGSSADALSPEVLPPEGEPIPPESYEVPDAEEEDVDALHKCLAQWNSLPFDQTITNYKKIYAAVTVMGYGNAVTDTEATDEPQLTLITAGVNVLGEPTYKLLNPNGYYCIKVNVNVQTKLTVELHCNARLADSKINVNVMSEQNDVTSAVGVHVLSTVDVVTVRPEGDECVR